MQEPRPQEPRQQEPRPKKRNINQNRRNMLESAWMVAIGAMFIFMGHIFPAFSLFILFTPLPLMVITYRNGVHYGILSGVVLSLVLMTLIGPVNALGIGIMFILPGIVMGYAMQRGQSQFYSIFWGFITMTFTTLLFIRFISLFLEVDILGRFMEDMQAYVSTQTNALMASPLDLESLFQTLRGMFPSLIISSSVLLSFVNYYAAAFLLRRVGERRPLGMMYEFSLPGSVPFGLLLVYFLTFLAGLLGYPGYEALKSNLILVFGVLFFLQGMAVISFFMTYYRVHRIIRFLAVVTLIVLAPLSTFVSIVGLFDTAMNFRRLKRV